MLNRLATFGPLPLRIILATSFLAHRVPSFADFARVEGFVASLGLPPGIAYVVAALEVGGAIAILSGVATRTVAGFFIIFMTFTSLAVKLERGYIGGFEVDLLLLSIAASLMITGPGRISIEWDVLKRELIPKGKKMVQKAQ